MQNDKTINGIYQGDSSRPTLEQVVQAKPRPGNGAPSRCSSHYDAITLLRELGIPERTAREVLEKMEHGDYIRRFAVSGRHLCYPIMVQEFPLSQGEHNGEQQVIAEPRSTDPTWKPENSEGRLLDFLAEMIIGTARQHPRVTTADVAGWLASIVVGKPQRQRVFASWKKKSALAREVLEAYPDCEPARNFLKQFKEKFGAAA